MKSISFWVSVLTLSLIFLGCSGDAPRIRAQNNRPTKVTIAVKPISGSTIHISDVKPGAMTTYIEIQEGSYEVEANIEGGTETPATTLNTAKYGSYTIVVINSSPATVRIDSP